LHAVFRALESMGLRWYLTGSEALAADGAPRQTMDTDVIVEAAPAVLDRLGATLADGYLYAEPIHAGGRWMASLIDRSAMGKVDLIVRDPDGWGRAALGRRVAWRHPAWGPVWVSTLEDLVLAKLEWSEGTSELRLRDCASLLRMNRDRVDMAYLSRWAGVLGIADRLDRALHAA
jgi:hypothetical protein